MGRPRAHDDRRATAIRFDPDVHARLVVAAKERQVSANLLVNRAVDEFLNALLPVEEIQWTRRRETPGPAPVLDRDVLVAIAGQPSRPGDTLDCWWEDDNYQDRYGPGIVLASSRSKRSIPVADAVDILNDLYDETVTKVTVCHWLTFTQAQADADEIPIDGDVGSYGEDGWGQAWIDVALPVLDVVACETMTS